MSRLNAAACEAALAVGAHACTDVTGFGLLGHLIEMLAPSGVGAVVEAAQVPLLPGALDYCGMGMLPAGGARSKTFFGCKVDRGGPASDVLLDLLFDAQTSGGLLISAADAEGLVARLHAAGIAEAAVIGRVVAEPVGRVRVV
jgi:selenide,water dikinase